MTDAAKRLFGSTRRVRAAMQRYRPFICPFEEIIHWVPPGSSVLDVGCGSGLFLGLLADHSRLTRGVGFDACERAIDSAKDMARQAGLENLTFLHLPVQAEWPEGLFDVVSVVDVIHHVPVAHHRELILAAAAKVRPGGRLIVKDIPPTPRWRAMAARLHDLLVVREWVRFIPRDRLTAIAGEAGLVPVHAERIDMLWYAHDLCVFERPEVVTIPRRRELISTDAGVR